MKTHEIKVELYKRHGGVQSIVAKQVGVDRQNVDNVLKHVGTERAAKVLKIAHGISQAIERPIDEIFPELAEAVDIFKRGCSCNG